MSKKIAVVLSGCGYLDGAEITEAVLSLYFLDRAGAEVQCFAPDRDQMHVVDHASGEAAEGETRNVLRESARIARGQVEPLADARMADFDGLVIPGGFGAAKNLSTFATQGTSCDVDTDLVRLIDEALEARKPIAAVCIAPAVVAAALAKLDRKGARVTIGTDEGTAEAIQSLGSAHQNCQVTEVAVDSTNRIVTAPAFMFETGRARVGEGIEKAIGQLMTWLG